MAKAGEVWMHEGQTLKWLVDREVNDPPMSGDYEIDGKLRDGWDIIPDWVVARHVPKWMPLDY